MEIDQEVLAQVVTVLLIGIMLGMLLASLIGNLTKRRSPFGRIEYLTNEEFTLNTMTGGVLRLRKKTISKRNNPDHFWEMNLGLSDAVIESQSDLENWVIVIRKVWEGEYIVSPDLEFRIYRDPNSPAGSVVVFETNKIDAELVLKIHVEELSVLLSFLRRARGLWYQ